MKRTLSVNGFDTEVFFSDREVEEILRPLLRCLTQKYEEEGRRQIAFMAGPPAAGKSTLALFLQELSREEGFAPVQALGMDGFHYPNAYLDTHTVQLKAAGGTSWSEDSERYPFSLSSASGFSFNSGNTLLHGYPAGSIYGSHYLYGHAAYDAGLWDADLGYSTLPIGLSRIGAGVYADWGYAWRKGDWDILKSKYDLGVNLYIDWTLGYRLPVRMTLGYAWGGAPRGGHQVYMYFVY